MALKLVTVAMAALLLVTGCTTDLSEPSDGTPADDPVQMEFVPLQGPATFFSEGLTFRLKATVGEAIAPGAATFRAGVYLADDVRVVNGSAEYEGVPGPEGAVDEFVTLAAERPGRYVLRAWAEAVVEGGRAAAAVPLGIVGDASEASFFEVADDVLRPSIRLEPHVDDPLVVEVVVDTPAETRALFELGTKWLEVAGGVDALPGTLPAGETSSATLTLAVGRDQERWAIGQGFLGQLDVWLWVDARLYAGHVTDRLYFFEHENGILATREGPTPPEVGGQTPEPDAGDASDGEQGELRSVNRTP